MDLPLINTTNLSIAIQAGGKSNRMGTNKAKVEFLGQPLILRIIKRLQPLSAELLIVSNTEDLDFPELQSIPIYKDILPDHGPLGGLMTALTYAKNDLVAMVACDLPFVSPALIALELDTINKDSSDVVIPKTNNGLEPLHALYRRENCLPAVVKALTDGKLRMISWLPDVKITVLEENLLKAIDPRVRMFLNLNTIQELRETESLEN